jgi:hypothetical protein
MEDDMKRVRVVAATICTGLVGVAPAASVNSLPSACLRLITVGRASTSAQNTNTSSQQEQRDQPVTEDDLRILVRANELLKDESVWNRNDDRVCDDDERTGKRSLFCALQKACIEVLLKYEHRRVALQEVRFAVEEATKGRDFEHRLRDFNNLPETRLVDVKKVIQVATDRVKSRLKK